MDTHKQHLSYPSCLEHCTRMALEWSDELLTGSLVVLKLLTMMTEVEAAVYPDAIFGYRHIFLGIHRPLTRLWFIS